jgi:hypothetical protein
MFFSLSFTILSTVFNNGCIDYLIIFISDYQIITTIDAIIKVIEVS